MRGARAVAWGLTFSCALFAAPARAFDHGHAAWSALLARHVAVATDGNASAVRYAALQAERPALQAYLDSLSAVAESEYAGWTKPQRLAFLINAYNAFTVELVLTKYPALESIRELGGLFQSPWKKRFFTLLGRPRSLDDVEHGMIRAPDAFDEPRIHVALVCASVGCPMLRPEAYVAARLEAQLEDGMRRFLSDASRNRFEAADGRLRVSKLFDWYGKDFERGHAGFDSLGAVFARYADRLAPDAAGRARIRAGDYALSYLEYDWRLNDAGRP
ncbi:MAG: DUF547 domain-containing protein [Betaproteobacteria bacterium HGW-Betaproteobacteria-14]|nr:MAG: DUF547 domain-containing protein [Betaproteobacteria bacterium HGW-Betaproteobacteria-14]